MQDDKIGEDENQTKEDENQTKEDENQTKKTKIRPLLFSGGRSEGESRLLAPVLFCTPKILQSVVCSLQSEVRSLWSVVCNLNRKCVYDTQTMQDDKIGEDENQTKEDENQTKKTKIRRKKTKIRLRRRKED